MPLLRRTKEQGTGLHDNENLEAQRLRHELMEREYAKIVGALRKPENMTAWERYDLIVSGWLKVEMLVMDKETVDGWEKMAGLAKQLAERSGPRTLGKEGSHTARYTRLGSSD